MSSEMTGIIDYHSLTRTLHQLASSAYSVEFEAEPSGLYCARLDLRLSPEEFDIVAVYYFDAGASRKGQDVLYLVSSLPGIQGTLVLAMSDIYSEGMSFEMALKLRTDPYGEWICS